MILRIKLGMRDEIVLSLIVNKEKKRFVPGLGHYWQASFIRAYDIYMRTKY